ncbi:MAG: OmpA family protein [Bacteroidia bacterium]|nr:OmpA family protein [Bacteroidia bacterium]
MKIRNLLFILLGTFNLLTPNNGYCQSGQDMSIYNNYDFIPGEQVLFEDNFVDSKLGEFPSRWKLLNRQGAINNKEGENYFVFDDAHLGGMGKVEPRIKTKSYLSSAFTIEFDFFIVDEAEGYGAIAINFDEKDLDGKFISILPSEDGFIGTNYFSTEETGKIDIAVNSPEIANLKGKWAHFALAYKDKQIKCYINETRILVVPNCEFSPIATSMSGTTGVRFKNYKLALGGGMNMLDKILTDGKFVSRAIKFDVNKATIKGESMGFINELTKWLKANPTVKLQVTGHTDSDGDDASNMKLSQVRAESVMKALVSGGIAADRLKAIGMGESKPSSSNDTPEGKADNRRVEFIKI